MSAATGASIFLLDCSGSMGGPFGGKTRLESAKNALIQHLGTFPRRARVVICAFDHEPRIVYDGLAGDLARITAKLAEVSPRGGTNIDVAVEFAVALLGERTITAASGIVIIGDGEWRASTATKDVLARLESQNTHVSTVLIGGDARAGDFDLAGVSHHVEKPGDLAPAVAGAASVPKSPAPARRLAFTAMHTSQVRVNEWHDLVFSAHPADIAKQVRKHLQSKHWQMSTPHAMRDGKSVSPVERQTKLTITPIVAGVEFNPPSHEIYLLEDLHETMFRFRATQPSANGVWTGVAEVHAEDVMVASVPLNIEELFGSDTRSSRRKKVTSGGVWRRVFASYARSDAQMVDAIVAAYDLVGAEVFIDRSIIQSGQEWRAEVQKAIDRADVFQLFWSKAASISAAVDWEWRTALKVQGKEAPFIRPVTWEVPCPPAPAELAHLHFEPRQFEALFRDALDSELNGAAAAGPAPVDLVVFGADTVVPDDVGRELQEDCRTALDEVERMTGIPCPPVLTEVRGQHSDRSATGSLRITSASTDAVVRDPRELCAEIAADCRMPRWLQLSGKVSRAAAPGRTFGHFLREFADRVEYDLGYMPQGALVTVRFDGDVETTLTIAEFRRALSDLRNVWYTPTCAFDLWFPFAAGLPAAWSAEMHSDLVTYLSLCGQVTTRFGTDGRLLADVPDAVMAWLSPRWWRQRELLVRAGVPGVDRRSNALETVVAAAAADPAVSSLREELTSSVAEVLQIVGRPQLVTAARSLSVVVDVGLKDALTALFVDLGYHTCAAVMADRWHASTLACEHLRAFLSQREQVSPYRDEDVEIIDTLVHWLGLHLVRDVPALTALAAATVPPAATPGVDEVEKAFRTDGMPAVQHLVALFVDQPKLAAQWFAAPARGS